MAEPILLSDVVAEISRLYATVKQRLDKKSLKALGNALIALRKIINEDLLETLKIVNNGELSDQLLNTWDSKTPAMKLDLLKTLEQKVLLEESVELSKFFANVSTAVIDAQKNLNEFSGRYVSELEKTNSRIPPTYFAIPSIKAEMKLGLSEMTSKGVNVILFKNKQQKEQYVESTVTFELVAAPPLPARPPEETEEAPTESVLEEGVMEEGAILESMISEGLDLAPVSFEPLMPPLEIGRTPEKEEESDVVLTESLELARAALFAATDRLIEAKEEVIEDQKRSSFAREKKKAAPKAGKGTSRSATSKSSKKATAKKAGARRTAKKRRE